MWSLENGPIPQERHRCKSEKIRGSKLGVESMLKSPLPLVICVHDFHSCDRCIAGDYFTDVLLYMLEIFKVSLQVGGNL